MSDKSIVLHLGAHKTATTSVQHWCRSNPSQLGSHGIVFIDHTHKPISTYRIIRAACEAARGETEVGNLDEKVQMLRDSLARQLDNPRVRRILIPWEIFLGEPYDPACDRLYPHLDQSADALAQLFEGFPLHIIYTLRDQFDFLNSWFVQLQKMGRRTDRQAFRAWAETGSMSWQNVVRPLEARFPRSQVRVLAYKTHGMLPALLAAYGLPADQADVAGHVLKNRGWSDPAMQIAALAMPKLDGSERDRLRALLDDLTQDHPLPSFQVLDDSLKPRLQVQYADDLVALRAESA